MQIISMLEDKTRMKSNLERLEKVMTNKNCRVRSEQLIAHIWDGQILSGFIRRDVEVKVDHEVTFNVKLKNKKIF